MNNNIVVPALGESISEATVSKWLKKKGESVKVDEPIVEVETDKVNVEVPSPAEGIISKINYNNGDTVKVGALLGSISGEKKEVHSENKEVENKVDPEEKIVPITKSKKIQEKEEPKIKKNPKNEKKEQQKCWFFPVFSRSIIGKSSVIPL